MRNQYKKLTRAELIEELEKLESQRQAMGADEPESLVEQLHIHQVELEMQNRELREAQQDLEESRNHYADLYDFAPVGYVSLDDKGVILQINLTASAMLGVERERLVGMPFSRYVQPEDRGTFMEYMSECEMSEDMVTTELRLVARGKVAMDVELSCAPYKNKPGEAVVYGTAITDFTERKLLEEILRESEGYYRSLFENAYEVIVVLNPDGTHKYSRPSMKRISGYALDELEGRSIFELIHPDDVQHIRGIFSQGIQEPGYTANVELRFQHKDGSWHIYEAVGMNLLDDPAVGGVVVNAREITERKRLENELVKSNEELRAFAHTLSHDLRSSLSIIEGFSDAALEASEENQRAEETDCLKHIIRGVQRAQGYIESVLQYAQSDHPEEEAFSADIEEVLLGVLMDYGEDIHDLGVEVENYIDVPPVMVNPIRLQQVFMNLIGNALKYLGNNRKPRIKVGAEKKGDTVTLYVSDNGVGISPEDQQEIFDPFKRFCIDGGFGLGIGLSTVKRAAEAWGGEVWVESEPGKGSTFFFTAPVAD